MKYFISVLVLFFSFSLKAEVKTRSTNDLKEIKSLFDFLIQSHGFAYTIFGSKPMSLADVSLELPRDLDFYRQLKARLILSTTKNWLNAWYKNRSEFSFNNFIFLDKEEDLFDCLVLVLINKKNMIPLLHTHEAIFKEVLGDSFTPETFLEKIEKREITLAKAIHDNDRLLGIMLGYGTNNATLFQQRFDLLKQISIRKKENLPPSEELIQKLNVLEARCGDFSEFEEEPIVPPLYFLADLSNPETPALKKQYENDRQKIVELMQKPHFLDGVLERLVE